LLFETPFQFVILWILEYTLIETGSCLWFVWRRSVCHRTHCFL